MRLHNVRAQTSKLSEIELERIRLHSNRDGFKLLIYITSIFTLSVPIAIFNPHASRLTGAKSINPSDSLHAAIQTISQSPN
ncbi:uncharacterized protein BDV14DRAFT_177935 [Aspergillus stella-maris]|uniref:uncharacterized protein n=1 Tax=Aspergillus stella-maris TaxID=1810926 RepID=UPI003CCD8D3E